MTLPPVDEGWVLMACMVAVLALLITLWRRWHPKPKPATKVRVGKGAYRTADVTLYIGDDPVGVKVSELNYQPSEPTKVKTMGNPDGPDHFASSVNMATLTRRLERIEAQSEQLRHEVRLLRELVTERIPPTFNDAGLMG